MSKDVLVFVRYMYDSILKVEHFVKGISQSQFMDDTEKQFAVMRAIEIMGEAAKNVPAEFREKHPQILWKEIAGMRDKLIHHYFGINLERVWMVVQKDLPLLKEQLRALIQERK